MTWFTTMLGKKGTLRDLRAALRLLRVPSVRTTEFVQVCMESLQPQDFL